MYLSEKARPIDFYKPTDAAAGGDITMSIDDLPRHHHHQLLLPADNNSSSGDDHHRSAPQKKRAETWSLDETRALISLRRDIDSLFNTSKSNRHLWDQISAKMREKGFDRSATMCTDKWRNLLKEFKKVRSSHRAGSPSGKMSYFGDLEDLLRDRQRIGGSHKSPPASDVGVSAGAESKVNMFMQFTENGLGDGNIPFGSGEADDGPRINIERTLDPDDDPLALTTADAVGANGVPPWNWRENPGEGVERNTECSGRVILVKWGGHVAKIGIDGTGEAIKEAIKSTFGLPRHRCTDRSKPYVPNPSKLMMQSANGAVPPPMTQTPPQMYGQPPQQWMMPPQQPQYQIPQPQYQIPVQQQMYGQQSPGGGEVKSLWIGDLQYWMDETYLHTYFIQTPEFQSVKVIRNKQTGQIEGYGFLQYGSRAAAEKVLATVNGTPMPGVEQNFRLNWASLGAGEKRTDDGPDFTIFVGDLAPDVSDSVLLETFKPHYPSVKGAKVVTDRLTGRPKGYGFVRFRDESEQLRAMSEMNGVPCSSRPMRIGPAATKNPVVGQQTVRATNPSSQANPGESDPNNTTIFVGGLDENVSDDILRQVFGRFGDLVHVKIVAGKRCGFVQFATRASAEQALSMLNGTQIGGQSVRLSWGRSPNKQTQPDQAQYGAYYGGYGQGYDAYSGGYAAPPQDPNMYYGAAYPGYGNYPQQQQQQ